MDARRMHERARKALFTDNGTDDNVSETDTRSLLVLMSELNSPLC
jgi:hypothetical protein